MEVVDSPPFNLFVDIDGVLVIFVVWISVGAVWFDFS